MQKSKIQCLTGISILSAVVVVLQLLGSFIHFGPVSVSLVLIPIVVGAAVFGPKAGAVLGGVFAAVFLMQPDTAFFYAVSFWGTVLTVLAKGILSGLFAGKVFQLLRCKNEWMAVLLSAAVCPIVNTGIFCIGSRLFFWDALAELGGGNALLFLITGMIGLNFIAEFFTNLVCAPVIVRILRAIKR